jgi:alpha-galactosidase
MSRERITPATTADDMSKSRAWIGRFFSSAANLPISFIFNAKAIHGIPEKWHPASIKRLIDANISEIIFEGDDPKSGLNIRVECLEYHDYPVVEWAAWFTNKGNKPTPVISDILGLDEAFRGSSPVLHHSNGDFWNEDGYKPIQTPLSPGQAISLAPNGGRPCDGAFPYCRIVFEDCGITIAIGWPGQWAAGFTGLGDGVRICAGQEKTNLRLMPGERIRTPRMTIMSWSGDIERAVNLWRRWYLAHILPRNNGRSLKPMLACGATDEGVEFTEATEANQLRYMEKFKYLGIPFDVWWIDAGWYPCYDKDHKKDWGITGTWEPDPERFPNGFKPISDRAEKYGARLLVWFEPERVKTGTTLDVKHPEWLLRKKDDDNKLLYLGNPECRQWLTDHVCRLIKENGIKIYRQDHNFEPLEYWRSNEAQDRQGVNENLHIQGYLQYWDDLITRNPDLWIDSCASGGRRNDLETMRRSVPLHYTDYGYGDHPVKLAFHRTMYEWLPYFKECTLSWDINGKSKFDIWIDSFSYHCGMAAMLLPTLDIRRDDYDYALAKKMIGVWRKASNLILYGDYYQHTPFHHSAKEWVAWQFDSPETGCGLLQGIRLPASTEQSITLHPKGICTKAMYFFENSETGETKQVSGENLIQTGFTITLPVRNGAIWLYRKIYNPIPAKEIGNT